MQERSYWKERKKQQQKTKQQDRTLKEVCFYKNYLALDYSQIQVDLNSWFICYKDNSIADQREDFASKVDQSFLSKITRGKKVDNLYEK